MMSFLTILTLLLVCGADDGVGPNATEPAPGWERYAGNACVDCHRKEGGRLAEMVDLKWAKSVHFENNVPCEQCHGGDATLTSGEFASDEEFKRASHATFSAEFLYLRTRVDVGVKVGPEADTSYACRECHKWTIEQRGGDPHGGAEALTCLFKRHAGAAMSRERGITYICASCHPESAEKHLGSPHGSRAAPSCLFCHGEGGHAMAPTTIEIIDPRPREELGRCSLCHTTGSMMAVAHIRKTLEETAERIQVAAGQYEELQRLRYRSLALGEMYNHIDDIRVDLRQVQHGCNVREINELAKSIENIGKRVAYDHEMILALNQARQGQTKIALGAAALLLVLAGMLLLYRKASEVRIRSWTLLNPKRRSLTPPCNHACPAGNDVQGFIASVMEEDFDEALGILLKTSPFPGVCGRVCPAPCMDDCNRRVYDEVINIRELERYVADHGRWAESSRPEVGYRVAVVGSGPAGLSATYHLARLGHSVTLFERDDELGGVMRTGIPAYRLPVDVLDREINRILEYDVRVRTGELITQRDLLRVSNEFDAVLLATGLQQAHSMDLGDGLRDVVLQGLDLLDNSRKGRVDLEGKDVVVVGGGSVAIDVARTARRLTTGAVRLFCLETRDEMPAHAEEIEEAAAEGIEINTGWGPVAGAGGKGKVGAFEFRRCLAVFDEDGAFTPSFDEQERMKVDAGVIVLAMGRTADLSVLPEGSKVREGKSILGATGAPVFVCGDFAKDEGSVAAAIGSGRRAATYIRRILTGEDLFPLAPEPIATPDKIMMHLFAQAKCERGRTLADDQRRTSFAEVHLGLPDSPGHDSALAEAERCFSCGVCNQCDRCVSSCSAGAVMRQGDEYLVEYDYCAGCGACTLDCPRGVIHMEALQVSSIRTE
ncbi:MAG: FAD-dependent oxidoreductase [Phycisphaerales bacterium]|nr:MAG: FAD-dependent oxidoreductase [Phycisphaerales bacterium]